MSDFLEVIDALIKFLQSLKEVLIKLNSNDNSNTITDTNSSNDESEKST